MAFALLPIQLRARSQRHLRLRYQLIVLIVLITMVGLLLAVLHGIEAGLWALAYLWLGAFGSLKDATLYSVDSMATRGASGMTLAHHWHMMGALEATDGMLLFGISTAFIFAVLQAYWLTITVQLRH